MTQTLRYTPRGVAWSRAYTARFRFVTPLAHKVTLATRQEPDGEPRRPSAETGAPTRGTARSALCETNSPDRRVMSIY